MITSALAPKISIRGSIDVIEQVNEYELPIDLPFYRCPFSNSHTQGYVLHH